MSSENYNFCIIGGGIVGMATAYSLSAKYPNKTICVLEKEPKIALHQTGRNSGVMHSGIYYKPNSAKAKNCRKGKKLLEAFCKNNKINYDLCGKVILATNDSELPSLHNLLERGHKNGVDCSLISSSELSKLEPNANAILGIHVPECGIIDYTDVCEKFSELFLSANDKNEIHFNAEVDFIESLGGQILVGSRNNFEITADITINCSGLQSDRISKISGQDPEIKIIPFKGEYFELKSHAHGLCKNLIYPVPDPQFPFLGVHFTRMIKGGVECGPNAVFALGREAYGKFDFNTLDLLDSVTYRGFLKMASKHWKMGLFETYRSFSKKAFVKSLQRLVPDIQSNDIVSAPCGIRAQAIKPNGDLVDDFIINNSENIINVCNAPSPAATSCLGIADHIISYINS